MPDQNNSPKKNQEPQAPSFMQPRRPFLDEPLEDDLGSQPVDSEEVEEDTAPVSEDMEPTQELQPERNEQRNPEKETAEGIPKSPYFPRGIYEDAQSVEAYYGRGEIDQASTEDPASETFVEPFQLSPLLRWVITALAFLLILALILLTLTKGLPLDFL